jgi:hypothetical protein
VLLKQANTFVLVGRGLFTVLGELLHFKAVLGLHVLELFGEADLSFSAWTGRGT